MSPTAAVTMILVGSIVLYVLACVVRPVADCFRCAGTGRHRHLINGRRMTCARCAGTGDRIRIGRRVADALLHRVRSAR